MALGVVEHIAESTVGRWLAQERIRPWRFHTWQHILDPQAFLQRARPVLSRYERQGAIQLFAGLSMADGRVYSMCRNRRHFVDFQAFLLEVILPEALRRGMHTVALILDNGTTHAPQQLDSWLKRVIRERGWSLQVEVHWLPVNASWLNQIEIWFSVLQRKLLQPNDFEGLQAPVKAIGSFVRYRYRTAKPIHWTYTIEKLEQKLGAH